MKNNNKYLLSTLAVALLSATSYSATAQSAKLKNINKLTTDTSAQASFAQWRANEKLSKYDYTDQLIIQFKDKNQGHAIPPGLAKKVGLDLKHIKQLKNGQHTVSIGELKHIKDLEKFIEKMRKHPSVEMLK